ncbi:hypothetical protein RLOC_00013882 [Lonchura striata]|uniref:Uncharacterized protein n=2 Tax=Lonchura striata TaxID=40157 RepID=A0A218V9R6_9PASE|nr:hypothetical protein RLOC_00013882 [Lonchura striata domestica]
MKKYFLKRTMCPGQSRVNQRVKEDTNIIMSTDAMSSRSFGPQPVPSLSPTSHSRLGTEEAVIPTSSPVSTQPNPSGPQATEVTASGQQQGHLPNSDIEDLLLRITDSQVQTSLQTMKLLMSVGNTVKEEELQKAATSLLVALNNANVSWSPTN